MSDIPAARQELLEIAVEVRAAGISTSADEIESVVNGLMKRQPPITRADTEHRKLTPKLAGRIRDYHVEFPRLSQQRIANHFNVATGRVSEALNWKI